MMLYDIFDSPLGSLTVSTDSTSITGLHIAGDRYFNGIPAGWTHDPAQPLLQRARRELDEYFARRRKIFELPLLLQGTPFQKRVWRAIQQIPAGDIKSYAAIAQTIGSPHAVRAVGTAVGRNPICIIVPCHRVVASNGGLGGYVAGVEAKQRLLTLEASASQRA